MRTTSISSSVPYQQTASSASRPITIPPSARCRPSKAPLLSPFRYSDHDEFLPLSAYRLARVVAGDLCLLMPSKIPLPLSMNEKRSQPPTSLFFSFTIVLSNASTESDDNCRTKPTSATKGTP